MVRNKKKYKKNIKNDSYYDVIKNKNIKNT